MAGVTIHLTAQKQDSLQEIYQRIRRINGAEEVSKAVQTINNVTLGTMVFEKYYFRTGSYASMTVVLTEHEQSQTAYIVASGGGEGIVNHSFGANRNLARECLQILESCGFTAVSSDLSPDKKGLLSRLFE